MCCTIRSGSTKLCSIHLTSDPGSSGSQSWSSSRFSDWLGFTDLDYGDKAFQVGMKFDEIVSLSGKFDSRKSIEIA